MTTGRAPEPQKVFRALRRRYHIRKGRRVDPFQTLVATVLSQRTRDENTALASARLFERFPDASSLAAAPLEEVKRLIRPSGFYRVKARVIIRLSRALLERHGGEVPRSLEELLALPGVGRKTANCVLVYSFGIPAIPVDTHVHRISCRLGWARARTPEETEKALSSFLPKRHWLELNELFVLFGRELCRPIGPRCSECPVARCPSRGRIPEGGRRGRASVPGLTTTLLGGLGELVGKSRRKRTARGRARS